MGDEEEVFDVSKFQQQLLNVKNTQDSISAMSNWCLQHRTQHKKIVATWLTVLKQVKIEHRLTLFNLANDVIQYSKRKNYDFVSSWGTALQRATTMVRDDKVKHKILRIFKIWEDRAVYNEDFLSDLNGLLNTVPPAAAAAAAKKSKPDTSGSSSSSNKLGAGDVDSDEFQVTQLTTNINNCVKLQERTDKAFKHLSKAPPVDVDRLKHSVKDREQVEEVEQETNDSLSRLEVYIQSLKAEIKVRKLVITALGQAEEFYKTQRGDVKTVAIAYCNFGNRIKSMKKKLDELTPTLPSPMPSPDINAPSPPPDNDDFDLPCEPGFLNGSVGLGGFSSFIGTKLPFDISDFSSEQDSFDDNNRIQVINSRSAENATYEGMITPQPVPPVGIQAYNSASAGFDPVAPSYSGTSGGSGIQAVTPLAPPPLPPMLAGHSSDEYTPAAAWDESWEASLNSLNNGAEQTPVSPPFFERKGAQNVAEYNESDHIGGAGSDIDQRNLSAVLPAKNVDHRNLISLTGSPGQPQARPATGIAIPVMTPPINNNNNNTINSQPKIQLPSPHLPSNSWAPPPPPSITASVDYRSKFMPPPLLPTPGISTTNTGIPPPPMPPVGAGYYSNQDSFGSFQSSNMMPPFNRPPMKGKSPQHKNGQRDNLEAVDMEMSDEESLEDIHHHGHMANEDNDGEQMGGPFMNYAPPPPIPPQMQSPPWRDNMNNNNMNNNMNNNNMNNNINNNNMNSGPWMNNQQQQPQVPPQQQLHQLGPPQQRLGGFFGSGDAVSGNGTRPPLFGQPGGGGPGLGGAQMNNNMNNFRPMGNMNMRGGGPRGVGGPMNNGGFRPRGRVHPFRGNFRGGPPMRGGRGGMGMW